MSDSSATGKATVLEIGREYPPEGEPAAIQKLGALHQQVHQKQPGPDRRGEHPKAHAGLRAQFIVEANIPREFRFGIFAKEATYTALVRYSNGRAADDRQPDAHGMAVKVLVPNAGKPGDLPIQQDFLLADHSVFFARDVQHLLDFLVASVGGVPKAQLAATTHPKLIGFTSQAQSSLFSMTYWSQTPYKLGDSAVKYLLMPSPNQNVPIVELSDGEDSLKVALVTQLTTQKSGAKFDFCINPQTNATTMPVEDPTVEWTSPPVKLATISIDSQSFGSDEQVSFIENLSWSPWNCLPEHRPLGGINRAREIVYRDSRDLRFKTKGVHAFALTGREVF
jgi:hypothetical protein